MDDAGCCAGVAGVPEAGACAGFEPVEPEPAAGVLPDAGVVEAGLAETVGV